MPECLLHRFLFSGLPVRGALVQLSRSWIEAMEIRAHSGSYPAGVRRLLGQMTAAGFLMQSQLKFDGALLLQLSGDGPLGLAVAEVNSNCSFRTTATLGDLAPDDAGLVELANVNGSGRLSITLDPVDRAPGTLPYQGIVPLHDDDKVPLTEIADAIEHYMLQSEQLDTRLILAANDDIAAGLLLQRMPAHGGNSDAVVIDETLIGQDEDFNRLSMLAATLTDTELLTLEARDVLHRLFHQEAISHFEPRPLRFACPCSAERVGRMLISLGRNELDDILEEQSVIEVACDFCGEQYRFDRNAVDALLDSPETSLANRSSEDTLH